MLKDLLPLKPRPGETKQDFVKRIHRGLRAEGGLGPRAGESVRAYAKRLILDEIAERGTQFGPKRIELTKKPTQQELRDILWAFILKKRLPPNAWHKLAHLLTPRSRGPKCEALWERDALICYAVNWIAVDCDIPYTKNPASETDSAAGIVAEVLNHLGENLTEERVARIWQQARMGVCGNRK